MPKFLDDLKIPQIAMIIDVLHIDLVGVADLLMYRTQCFKLAIRTNSACVAQLVLDRA
jgi:hypothetical protein